MVHNLVSLYLWLEVTLISKLSTTSGPYIRAQIEYIITYRECEGKIEKSVQGIAIWHHEACWVMTNGDPQGRIFLSYPHRNNGFFFLLTSVFIYLFKNTLPEVPEYAKMQFHMMILLDVLGKIAWVR